MESAPGGEAPADAVESDAEADDAAAAEAEEFRPRTFREAVEQELARVDDGEVVEDREPTSPAVPTPEDGKWLVDDQGRQYFVQEAPKVEGAYRRLEDGRVRLKHGLTVELAGETETTFLVKIFRVEPLVVERSSEPTEEEIAAVAAEYQTDLPHQDRLTAEDFGAGLPRAGQWRNGADLADMNGDGHLDLVHGSPRRNPGQPIVFLNDGAGHWTVWQDVRFPSAPFDYGDVEGADFDGDGVNDVAVAVHLGGLSAFRGDGAGVFAPWGKGLKLVPAGGADAETFLSRTLDSLDWDGDGDPDLVGISEGPRHPKAVEREAVETPVGLVIYENQGGGTWRQALSLGADRGLFGDSIATGDFDGDGREDLFVGTNARGVKQLVYLSREGWQAEPVEVTSLTDGGFVWGVAVADFDGNGLDDLVTASTARRLGSWWWALEVHLVHKGDDGLRFERRLLAGGADTGKVRVTAVTAGDLDGDGRMDVVGGTDEGRLGLYLGDGAGGFAVEEDAGLAAARRGCRTYHLHTADLDGTPGDELTAGFAGEQCQGGGSLRAWRFSPL